MCCYWKLKKRTVLKDVLNTQIIQKNDFYEQSKYRISGFLCYKNDRSFLRRCLLNFAVLL